MSQERWSFLDRLAYRSCLTLWSRAARAAQSANLSDLRLVRDRARSLRHKLNELLEIAETRLALPRIGSSAFPRPSGTDWCWRPDLWRGPLNIKGASSVESNTAFGSEVTLFHDCPLGELTLRQLRNQREVDLAPYGLRMDVFHFDGSFLSVVIDLPAEACNGLKRRHLIRLAAIVELERPLEIFARLNIRHGPNTEQIVRELPLENDNVFVEFDLAYTKLNEKRVERMWVDLIFEGPEMNEVTVRDVTFARYPRAEL